MKVFFVLCLLLAGLLGCGLGQPFEREPYYINNSGVDVKITINTNEQEIKNNDTLCNSYLNESCAFGQDWEIIGGDDDDCGFIDCYANSTYSKIEFLSEPKVCLVFEGDAKVGESDIRYWENYHSADRGGGVIHYYYTITPDLMQQAKEEFCTM